MKLHELSQVHKNRIKNYLIQKVARRESHPGWRDFIHRAGDCLSFEWRDEYLCMRWSNSNGGTPHQDEVAYVVAEMTPEQCDVWINNLIMAEARTNFVLQRKF